jgi:hypothetical protein
VTPRRFRQILLLALIPVGLALGALTLVRPSNDRVWIAEQALLPHAEFDGARVSIRNLRNFSYDAQGKAQPKYEDRTYDLDRIETVWFVLAPFDQKSRGPAHSFLSFGFADSQYVAVSVEARREQGEGYSLLKGLLRQFEIMYVIGDERDLIGMRVNQRGDDVYLYPITASRDKVRRLFVEVLERANRLHRHPEFYNTLTNNCTTNIVDHANQVSAVKIRFSREILLPGYADELALRLGLIQSPGDVNQVRARFLVNERARRYRDAPDFSVRIRS